MADQVRRGFVATDTKQFDADSIVVLRKAQAEILYLLERGYPIKSASTFVGNHYLLSERQRLAVVRATAEKSVVNKRLRKQLAKTAAAEKVSIDGMNLIITLEVALSGSTLVKCMDKTIRDLAGLRGTYRLIDKTEEAILLVGKKLTEMEASEVEFFLDAPVSNTGRLKSKILALLADFPFQVSVELVPNADVILERLGHVVTSDAIILNKCKSYYNLAAEIIEEKLPGLYIIDLSREEATAL